MLSRFKLFFLSALAFSLLGFSTGLAVAEEGPTLASGLKADTPKLDNTPQSESKTLRPLQAGLQHNENVKPRTKGMMTRLKGGTLDNTGLLKSRIKNQGAAPFAVQAQSSFGIIGVKFVLSMGQPPVINRVFAGTPASRVGIFPDDVIVAVDGVPTYGLSKEEVYDLIIGSPGTPVKVSILRGGEYQVFSCVRMDINELTDPLVRRDYLMSM